MKFLASILALIIFSSFQAMAEVEIVQNCSDIKSISKDISYNLTEVKRSLLIDSQIKVAVQIVNPGMEIDDTNIDIYDLVINGLNYHAVSVRQDNTRTTVVFENRSVNPTNLNFINGKLHLYERLCNNITITDIVEF